MEIIFRGFIRKILIFSAILAAISFTFFYFFPTHYFAFYPILFGIFVIISSGIHRILIKSAFNNPRRFTNTFMLTVMFKLFFYLILSAIYFFVNPESSKIFVICVLLLYLSYSTYEIYLLLADLKNIDEIRQNISADKNK